MFKRLYRPSSSSQLVDSIIENDNNDSYINDESNDSNNNAVSVVFSNAKGLGGTQDSGRRAVSFESGTTQRIIDNDEDEESDGGRGGRERKRRRKRFRISVKSKFKNGEVVEELPEEEVWKKEDETIVKMMRTNLKKIDIKEVYSTTYCSQRWIALKFQNLNHIIELRKLCMEPTCFGMANGFYCKRCCRYKKIDLVD